MKQIAGRVGIMRWIYPAAIAVSLLSGTFAHAQSADVEATITKVDMKGLKLTLSDGNTYSVPAEFDFEGLEKGVKVSVFYTNENGERVVNDLQVEK